MSRESESDKLAAELARRLVLEEAGAGDENISFPRAPVSIVYPINMNPRKLFFYTDVFTSSSVSEAESFYHSLRGSTLPRGLTNLAAHKTPQQKEYARMVLFYLVNLNRYIKIYRGFLAPDYPATTPPSKDSNQQRQFDQAIKQIFVEAGTMVSSIKKFADLALGNVRLDESTVVEITKDHIVKHLNTIMTVLLDWTSEVRNVGGREYSQLVPTMKTL